MSLAMQILFSPRPFFNFSRVVEACAIIFPPIGFVASFAKLIPSGLATTCKETPSDDSESTIGATN